MGRYDIQKVGPDLYELYEDNSLLCKFSRKNFRQNLTDLGRGSNWIGSILRILNKKYPFPITFPYRTPLERAVDIYGEWGLAEYLRSKGLRVIKPLHVSDLKITKYLESKGYEIAGIIDEVYYETKINENRAESIK